MQRHHGTLWRVLRRWPVTTATCFIGAGAGCGGRLEPSGWIDPAAGAAAAGPEELTVGGRRYVRPSALSEEDRRALTAPALWEPPETVDKLAQLLRAYILHNEYGEYVDAQPNYDAARRSLGIDPPLTASRGGNEPLTSHGHVTRRPACCFHGWRSALDHSQPLQFSL